MIRSAGVVGSFSSLMQKGARRAMVPRRVIRGRTLRLVSTMVVFVLVVGGAIFVPS